MNVLNLQPELLFIVFSFLDSYFLINTVALVCKTFYSIVECNYMWKTRKCYPIIKPLYRSRDDQYIDWAEIVCTFEIERSRWKNNGMHRMSNYLVKTDYIEDAVYNIHLIDKGKICVSDGLRGKAIKLWNIHNLAQPGNVHSTEILMETKRNAHDLPIMAITSFGTTLGTGGSDAKLNLWDLENGFRILYTKKCRTFVFCLSLHETMAAAGTIKIITILDIRQGLSPVLELQAHDQAVTDVYMNNEYIISTGTDATISVYDRRANKIFLVLDCPSKPNYVNRMSCSDGFIFGGDSRGAIHLWDMSEFHAIQTFNIGHTRFVTGLCHSKGCIFSSGVDGKVQVSSLSSKTTTWATFVFSRYISDMHYRNKVLAAACDGHVIAIWKPKVIN